MKYSVPFVTSGRLQSVHRIGEGIARSINSSSIGIGSSSYTGSSSNISISNNSSSSSNNRSTNNSNSTSSNNNSSSNSISNSTSNNNNSSTGNNNRSTNNNNSNSTSSNNRCSSSNNSSISSSNNSSTSSNNSNSSTSNNNYSSTSSCSSNTIGYDGDKRVDTTTTSFQSYLKDMNSLIVSLINEYVLEAIDLCKFTHHRRFNANEVKDNSINTNKAYQHIHKDNKSSSEWNSFLKRIYLCCNN